MVSMNDGGLTPEERQRQTAMEIARRRVMSAYAASEPQSFSSAPSGVSGVRQAGGASAPVISRSFGTGLGVVQSGTGAGGVVATNTVQGGVQNTAQVSKPTTQNLTDQTYKTVDPVAQKKAESWQKYHTAWQNYYQKYYADYYSKAAQRLVEGEKTRMSNEMAREKEAMQKLLEQKEAEQKQSLARAIISSEADDESVKVVERTLKERIQEKANSKFRLKRKHKKWIPIAAGVFVTLFVLFLQYNRLVFAPIMAYISPGNVTDEEIAAIDPTMTTAPNGESRLIIPKLNVDVPVHFGISNDTATINNAMDNGVAHFRVPGASAFPGEVGNTVITGHSAGDIYSSNQYKFIFSGLERLVEGDLIYVNYNSVRYTYKVTGRKTVSPSDVGSLVYEGDKPIVTLLTCWPTGTANYRLEVFAEQVNPAPGGALAGSGGAGGGSEPGEPGGSGGSGGGDVGEAQFPDVVEVAEMPSNSPTFFENVWSWLTGS